MHLISLVSHGQPASDHLTRASGKMLPLTTKQGQPSTYSPRTLETSRNRLGNFLSTIASLGSPSSARTRHSVGLPESPLRSRLYRRGGKDDVEELGQGMSSMQLRGGITAMAPGRELDSASSQGKISLTDLPDDLLLLIFEHLPQSARQLHTVSRVSHLFFDISQSPTLWAELYHATPGFGLSDQAIELGIAVQTSPAVAESWYHFKRPSSYPDFSTPSTPSKSTSPLPNTSPPSSSVSNSTQGQIPIHFPTLYRARQILSRTLRHPNPAYRHHAECLTEHSDSVYCIKSIGRWLFTGSRDRSIRIWQTGLYDDQGQPAPTRLVRMMPDAHAGSVLCIVLQVDEDGNGTMVTGSSDMSVKIWSIAIPAGDHGSGPDVELVSIITGHTAGVLDVVLTNRHIISCSKDTTIRVYDRQTFKLDYILKGHEQSVNSLAVKYDGTELASASGDGSWRLWDLGMGMEIKKQWDARGPGMACIAWQGNYIVTGDNARNVSVYEAYSGELLRVCKGHTDLVRAVGIDTQEGLVYSGSYDGAVRIWDLQTGVLVRNLPTSEPSTLVFDIHISPNKILVARQDKAIEIITLVTGLPYLDIMTGP